MRIVFGTILVLILFNQTANAGESSKTVERFIQAFNRHDVDAMLELSAVDLRWMSISGQEISIETSTHAELREAMSDYFASTPSARSKVRSISESGSFVYTLEEAFWSSGGVEKSQCSIAVYELTGEKIRNVWYFPEHSCP